jgi:hypothetical protein
MSIINPERNLICIRPLSTEDLPLIYQIGTKEGNSDDNFVWSADSLSEILISSMDFCYTAIRRKQIFGFMISSVSSETDGGRTVKIHKIMSTDPKNDFVIKLLLDRFFRDFHEKGYISCKLIVKKNDERLINILQNYRFTEKSQISVFEFTGSGISAGE